MSRQQSRQVIERELGGRKLESVFEWIELSPIGSASIAQVRSPRRFTMRLGSTAKVPIECKLKYYRISECACSVALACIPFTLTPDWSAIAARGITTRDLGVLPKY